MYKNALKEDLTRVVENLDSTVESTDTIVKLKTKIENSSTFLKVIQNSLKLLIQNCIDESSIAKRRVLCKKVTGAMNEFRGIYLTSPMKSKYRQCCSEGFFEPWQWKRRKRNRFEQTSRTLERKISMRSTKRSTC
ncbi:hypothetical protein TNCV_1666301 [Trichonephila clavipes]|nr:hypothetical protein TNCV_1666301 [Trichonephila clavipes]